MDDEMKVIPLDKEHPLINAPKQAVGGFVEFVRERGVVGLAIGFVLGAGVQKVVNALVNDLINPALGVFTGNVEDFGRFAVGPFLIGDFVSSLINFLILAGVIYFIFKFLQLDKLDKPKS